jgi:hypothetical protein
MQMPFTGERYVPEVRGQIYYEHVHRYALAFEIGRGLDVLDIASGEGYGAAYLALAARSVVGVDVDAESIRHAAARYTAMNLSFLTGSCTRIPLGSQSIDLVVSFETIEHIEEHEQFLAEIVRVLRPNGQLLISSPNKLVYSDDAHYHNPYHARELYFDEFRDLLQRSFARCRVYGQRIIATSAIHPLRGVARGARCITPAAEGDDHVGLPALPAPAYFLALCARSDDGRDAECQLLDSVFVDPRDDLLADIVHPELLLARSNGEAHDAHAIESPDGGAGAAQLEHLAAELAQVRDAVAVRDAQLRRAEGWEREARRLQTRTEELEREGFAAVAAERTATDAVREQLAAAAEEASRLEAALAAAEERARAADVACRSLRGRLDERESALRDAASAAAAGAERLRAELDGCRAEQRRAEAQLDEVLRSASWRVTKPIRLAVRKLRRA